MDLPVRPPLAPMLATLTRELPVGEDLLYEPKWDGFRCLAFRDGDEVDLRSRNTKELARYFPEIVNALLRVATPRFVLDGEIVVEGRDGVDFSALLQRLHPAASRIERLAQETPASLLAFDLLAIGADDLRDEPFDRRRRLLTELLDGAPPPLHLTPTTADADDARRWLELHGSGIEGVMVKPRSLRYEPNRRSMVKVKRERTADCVVAGFRWHGNERAVGSLLLGLYGGDGDLHHVGITPGLRRELRASLVADIAPFVTDLAGHPWEHGFGLDASPVGRLPGAVSRWRPGHPLSWVPLRPELVCEVAYDQLQGDRFRHAPRFLHWRPDRDPRSCTYAQFPAP